MQHSSGAWPSSVLPQELVDRIIDEVAVPSLAPDPSPELLQASDSSSPRRVEPPNYIQERLNRTVSCISSPGLLVCAQVSRAFRDRSRRHIFSEIAIRLDPKDEESSRAKAFWGLLEADDVGVSGVYVGTVSRAGGLAGLVRSFKLELRHDGGVRIMRGWMYDDPWTVKILPRLHNLERIALVGLMDDGSDIHRWSDFGEAMRGALWGIHGRQCVRMLRMGEIWSVPADFVLKWRSLRNLELVGTSFNSSEDAEHAVHGGNGQDDFLWLESLDTKGSYFMLAVDVLVARASSDRRRILERLRRFRAEPPFVESADEMRNHTHNVWNIVANASQTLEDLDLVQFFTYQLEFEAIPIDLDRIKFPSLRAIRIKDRFSMLPTRGAHFSEVLTLLCRVLCCLVDASSDSLECLTIDLSWRLVRITNPAPFLDCDLESLAPKTWAGLDESLSRVRGFKELDIAVTICYPSAADCRIKEEAGLGHLRDLWTPGRSQEVFPLLSAISSNPANLKIQDGN